MSGLRLKGDRMSIVYVAGKYTGDSYEEIDTNILKAQKFAVDIWNAGHMAFTPHLNTRHFERLCPNIDQNKYLELDLIILKVCNAVFMVPGWENSRGANIEHEEAKKLGIPIYYNVEDIK